MLTDLMTEKINREISNLYDTRKGCVKTPWLISI